MDPGSLAILMEHLAPVLGALAFFAAPIGIIWIVKSRPRVTRSATARAGSGR
jgi:hypothetical protein